MPNEATERWCDNNGASKRLPRVINGPSGFMGRTPPPGGDRVMLMLQRPLLPIFTPAALHKGMPEHWVNRSALYAGESALRLTTILSARDAVNALTP